MVHAIRTKRMHDVSRSGWVGPIPTRAVFWKGDEGPNRNGPPPNYLEVLNASERGDG